MKGNVSFNNKIRSVALGDFDGKSFLYADVPHFIIKKDTREVTCFDLSTSQVFVLSRDTKIIPVNVEVIVT